MTFKKLNSSNVFVLGLLFLCLVQAAYSRKCYSCLSLIDESCSLHPKQDKFMFDCDNAHETDPLMKYLNIKGITTSNEPNARGEMACTSLNLKHNGEKVVLRGCFPRTTSCDDIERAIAQGTHELRSCEQCFFDYCNVTPQIDL